MRFGEVFDNLTFKRMTALIQNLKLAMEEARKDSPNSTDFALSTITICGDEQALDMKVDINKANKEIKMLAT